MYASKGTHSVRAMNSVCKHIHSIPKCIHVHAHAVDVRSIATEEIATEMRIDGDKNSLR